jgi:hypothetical protein
MIELLRNRERREQLGAAARAYVEQHWTWEGCFGLLEQKMLAGSRQRVCVPATDCSMAPKGTKTQQFSPPVPDEFR